MKHLIPITIFLLSITHFNTQAQETHGGALNLGLGVGGYSGYFNYVGRPLPVFHIDYEFDALKNFTVAPFINFYTYSDVYYWGDVNNPAHNYTYREIVVPAGIKGTYYFDDLLKASSKWDFYAAGSVGVSIVNKHWEAGYNGNTDHFSRARPLFMDVHAGAEYHFSNHLGVFLDLSTGVSTVGVAFH